MDKSVRGGTATMIGQAFQFAISMINTIVLARLLTPSDFGLVGMVAVVTGFATMFQYAGLSIATIQKEKITQSQISTLFWVNLLISILLGLCMMALSPLIALFFRHAELTGITIALSLAFIAEGFTIQHQSLLYRHMRFVSLTTILILSQLLGLIASIISALFGLRYWALVVGTLVAVLISSGLTYYFCPWIPERIHKNTGAREMLAFGRNLTVGNLANYLSGNMDNVLVGRYIGAYGLGLYAKAYQLFYLPVRQFKDPLQNTALPALSSLINQPMRYRNYYQRFLDLLASICIPLALYCFLEADYLVRLFLGSQWLGVIPVFRVFSIVALIYPLAGTKELIMMSAGKSRRFLIWGVINSALCITSFVAGLPFGIVGVAAAFTLMSYLVLFPSLWYCLRQTPVTVALFLKTVLPSFVISTAAFGVALLVKQALPVNSLENHLLILLVFCGIYIGLSSFRKTLRELFLLILKNIGFPFADRRVEEQVPRK